VCGEEVGTATVGDAVVALARLANSRASSRSRMVALSGTAAPNGSAASSCSILVCGEAVGETVGAAVGLVGLVVGMDVGLVGATVGPDVGLVGVHVVGDVVLGARVGAAVGEIEGDSVVGVAEGAGEGACVGTALGVRNMPSSASMAWLISVGGGAGG